MTWEDRIVLNPEILVGKPTVKGTRLAVEFIIGLLAEGWSEAHVLKNYPGLTREDILACLAYASAVLHAEKVYAVWMRALADENFPLEAVEALRARGHDSRLGAAGFPGEHWSEVLARAVSQERVLVTFDKDFGELGFRRGLPAGSGVILFRVAASRAARRCVAVVEEHPDCPGRS